MKLKRIKFVINKDNLRPRFKSKQCAINREFDCLLDSGAKLPVWCASAKSLIKVFPSAVFQPKMKTIITGFGSGFVLTDVYLIPKLEIFNGSDSLIFKEFYLTIINRKSFGVDLILPSCFLKDSGIVIEQFNSVNKKTLEFHCVSNIFQTTYSKREVSKKETDNWKESIKKQIKFIKEKGNVGLPDPSSIPDTFTLIDCEERFVNVLMQELFDKFNNSSSTDLEDMSVFDQLEE